MKKLKQDNLFLGVLIGIGLPAIVFAILYTLSSYFSPVNKQYLIKLTTIILLAIFSNLLPLRYYLITLKLDKTGRGILLSTFIFAICYFITYSTLQSL